MLEEKPSYSKQYQQVYYSEQKIFVVHLDRQLAGKLAFIKDNEKFTDESSSSLRKIIAGFENITLSEYTLGSYDFATDSYSVATFYPYIRELQLSFPRAGQTTTGQILLLLDSQFSSLLRR